MDIKRYSQVSQALTATGSNGYVRVPAGSRFVAGMTVNLTSSGPSASGLQVLDVRGFSGTTDVAVYLIDPGNGLPFDASAYTVANSATLTAPAQTLWYGVTDDVAPVQPITDAMMQTILSTILPGGVTAASNVAVTNFPASQPVSVLTLPLPVGAATEATLATRASQATVAAILAAVSTEATLAAFRGEAAKEATSQSILTTLTNRTQRSRITDGVLDLALPTSLPSAAEPALPVRQVGNPQPSVVNAGNSSTATLLAGAIFTGASVDTLPYQSITLSASSDVISAEGGIELQWSADNVNWSTRGITELPASRTGQNQATDLAFRTHDRYFRVKYTNGGTNQTFFRLQTILHCYLVQPDGKGVAQVPQSGDDVILTKSVIAGRLLDGSYDDVTVLDHDAHGAYTTPGLAVRPILDQYYLTAFTEQRVSNPYMLADIVQKYGRDPHLISSLVATGGAIVDIPSMSGFTLSVTATSGSSAAARTNEWYRYQTGRGQQILLSIINSNAGVANQVRNWGYFDDNDGLLYRLNGTTMNVVRRTSTGESGGLLGSPYEQVVPQSQWNVDKMDGTGFSGINLDVTKGNIYEVRFQWLGVGTIQWFINTHLVHQMVHANTLPYPFMRSATLPLTWEVTNTAGAALGGLTAICGHVTSQSGSYPPVRTFAAVSGPRPTTSAAELPLLSIRLKQTLNTVDNRVPVLPRQLSVSETALNRAYIIVRTNATLTGAVWVSAGDASGVEYDNSATAVTDGVVVARYALADGADRDIDLKEWFSLNGQTVGRDAYTGVSDIVTISIQRVTGTNPTVDGTLVWHEVH